MSLIIERWHAPRGGDGGVEARLRAVEDALSRLQRMLDRGIYGAIENAAQLPGQTGGQTLVGDSDGSGDLVLSGPTRIILGTASVYDQANDRLGIGSLSPPSKIYAESAADNLTGSQIRTKNTNASGTSAGATLQAIADVAILQGASYGTGNTTTRFGLTLGLWSELVHNAGNGLAVGTVNATPVVVGVNNTEVGRFDGSSTADDTRFLLYDVTAGSMKRVSRGASDSGGVGFRVLRIPN